MPEDRVDERLSGKQWIVGLSVRDEAVAYPFLVLNDEPIVNDVVGGTPVAIVFDPNTASSAVFDRRMGEQVLTFVSMEGIRMIDTETGSFWFGWKGFYPHTEVYGGGGLTSGTSGRDQPSGGFVPK